MFVTVVSLSFLCASFASELNLPGKCPEVKLQENLDSVKFSGLWYNVANFASDGRSMYDCANLLMVEDNLGYTLTETYVQGDQGNRTQQKYVARVDPTFDAGNKAKFVISYEDNDKILQFPFSILATDYDNYAIAYTCKNINKKVKTHYVFTWILTRNKEKLDGVTMMNVQSSLAKYSELSERWELFVFKDFSDASCSFDTTLETDVFTSNFW